MAEHDLLRTFIDEAMQCLTVLNDKLLSVETAGKSPELIDEMFRAAHTMKGAAGFFNLTTIQKITHRIETVLDGIRQKQLDFTQNVVDALFMSFDTISNLLMLLRAGKAEPPEDIEKTLATLDQVIAASKNTNPKLNEKTLTAPTRESITILDHVSEKSPSEAAKIITNATNAKVAASDTIRIDTARLDQLMNVTGELIIMRARIAQLTENLLRQIEKADLRRAQDSAHVLRDAVNELNRHTNTMQNAVMQARMVPIGPLFQRFHRLVRDLSKERERKATLILRGENTELDKQVIDELADPLTHMIRNSVDHGIESPSERRNHNKPENGTIILAAYHQSGQVCLCLSDDGRGLDLERIKNKALDKGLYTEETLARLSTPEIYALILEPDFSTATQVTNISGRGVGMDIVRKKITSLKGAIEIKSEVGKGTTFTLRLPLTLAMIKGLLVTVGESRFAFPLEMIREIIDVQPHEIRTTTGGGRIINLREKIISLIDLPTVIGVTAAPKTTDTLRAIIARNGNEIFAVAVDSVIREEELVVKALAEDFQHLVGISGTSILGDGGIAMILDVIGLADAARKIANAKSG